MFFLSKVMSIDVSMDITFDKKHGLFFRHHLKSVHLDVEELWFLLVLWHGTDKRIEFWYCFQWHRVVREVWAEGEADKTAPVWRWPNFSSKWDTNKQK